jgi:type II secretory pathway component GspD/PulD (secretin)
VATNRAKSPSRRPRLGCWLGLALALLLSAIAGIDAQDAALRPREALRLAIDTYKRGDYESASVLFAQAYQRPKDLDANDRIDLERFGTQNTNALKGRQEGSAQLRKAEEALKQGRRADASNLLKTAQSNAYLAPGDRQALANLTARLQAATLAGAKGDPKALLAAARAALAQKDFSGADMLANEAEKAGAAASWLQPWADTPAKVHRDVQAARVKTPPPIVVKGPAETPEKKDSSWFPGMKNWFAKDTGPAPVKNDKPAMVAQIAPPAVQPLPPVPPPLVPLPPVPPPLVPPPLVPPVAQVQNTTPPSSPTNPKGPPAGLPAPERKLLARKMLTDGYKALQGGELETARRMAFQVKDLNVELDRGELGPDQLLHEVQKKSLAAAPKTPTKPDDSRGLVKAARLRLQKNQVDEAEKLCNQAAAVPNARWGLFEDSPEKLRGDIQKARAQHDRDESVKLLAEARKLFVKGQYDEAKRDAWKAEKLHGPYGVLDFGERPQRLLAEIARAESAQAQIARAEAAKAPNAKTESGNPAAPQKVVPQIAKKDNSPPPPDLAKVDPLVAAQAKAVALIGEARVLEQRGQLVEAREKAVEARKLGIIFRLGEDSPEKLMLSLMAGCKGRIEFTLKQVTDSVAGKPGEPARLQKALGDLAAARQLAMQFGLDTVALDQKAMWVQQATATAGLNFPSGPPGTAIAQVAFNSPAGDPKRQDGRDMLEKARLELKHGNPAGARKLAEQAYDPVYGVTNEATAVLRDIDAEEQNQRILAAQRSFDAGVDAFLRGNHKLASNIFVNIDLQLLPAQQQARLREIMATREMDPAIVQAGKKVVRTPDAPNKPAGVAVAGDQGNEPIDQIRAMEKVQLDQMAQRNAQAQTTSVQLFKAGQEMKAIEVLATQLHQLELAGLSPDAKKQLSAPLEKRMQEFRIMQAEKLLTAQRTSKDPRAWNEDKNQERIKNQQDQIADMLKQCNALNKEGKHKEALALAHKAKELDPDNLAANAFIQIGTIQDRLRVIEKNKTEDEAGFLELTDAPRGKLPNNDTPFPMDDAALKRLQNRTGKGFEKIESEHKNPKERRIQYRLDQPIDFGFTNKPLGEVIDDLSKLSGIPIYEDKQALDGESISLSHTLSMNCEGLAMKSALNILLGKMRLTYVIANDALMITTMDKASQNFKRVVYPVTDLIVPIDDHPIPDAADLAAVMQKHLNSLFQRGQSSASPITPYRSLQQGTPVSSFSNGLGGSSFGATSQSQPVETSYNQAPKRAPGETIQDLLMDLIKATIQPQTWKDMGGPGEVRYYPLGMALVVNQTQEVQGEILALLAALRRLQELEIAIEMRVVTVSELFYERIGVDFNVNLGTHNSPNQQNQILNGSFAPPGVINKNLGVTKVISGLTNAGTLTPDLGIPITNTSYNFSTPPFGGYTAPGTDGGLTVGLAFLSQIQVSMLLEAAQGDSRTNVMQAPKITVFNGQTAFINVTTTEFYNIGLQPIQQNNGQIIFQPQNTPFPFGTILRVTPVVSADRRFVRMNLSPNINAKQFPANNAPLFPIQVQIPNLVDGPFGQQIQVGQPILFTTYVQQPTFNTIQLNTTVNVPDGGTVLLGGLKTMSEGRNEAGPPILSKIPYLDRLFRNVGWGRDARSIMILVTPRIIINEEEEQIFMGQIPPIPRP